MAKHTKTCPQCLEAFTSARSDARYCSTTCRSRYIKGTPRTRECADCGVDISHRMGNAKFCSTCYDGREDRRRHEQAPEKVCPVCGKLFRRARQKHCSRECGGMASRAAQLAQEKVIECGVCGGTFLSRDGRAKWCSLQCRNWNAKHPGEPLPEKACETCGAAVDHLARRWCSEACRSTRRPGQRADTPALRLRDRIIECEHCGESFATARSNARFCGRWCGENYTQAARYAERIGRTCEWCNVPILTTARLGRRFCSVTHQVQHNTHIRRARMASLPAEDVSLGEVLQRDGWECHLCGSLCDKGTVSLDHLIPIAHPDSPGHVAANLGVAHRRCNSGKRDRVSDRDWERYRVNMRMEAAPHGC